MWKKIDDYENYSVSMNGDVRNDKTGRILKQNLGNGYYQVGLCKNGKEKKHLVHRLVAIAFIKKEECRDFVDHIDGDRTNNSLTNLRWCTHKENQQNQSLSKKNTSGFKGVYFHKARQKWRAEIMVDGKLIYLGLFDTIEQASVVRSARANIEFGDFTNSCEKI